MDDWSDGISSEIAALAEGHSLEDDSLQKRTAETWAQDQAKRKRAKSALDHAAHPNSFASLANQLTSMHNDDGGDTTDNIKRDAMDVASTIVIPVPKRPHARKSSIDMQIIYREEQDTIDLLGETEDVEFASQVANSAHNLTETQPESVSAVYKRIKLHPHVVANLSPKFLARLVQFKVDEFEIGPMCPSVTLRRETFALAAKDCREATMFAFKKMSKEHLSFELQQEPGGRYQVYAVDKHTSNGTKVEGEAIPRGGKVLLQHNQSVAILSSGAGTILLGYIVEDPHVLMAQHIAPKGHAHASAVQALPTVHLQENVLGVLFAAPLVGKDHQGNCHPLDELDLAKEYNNLKDALIDASKRMKLKPSDPSVTEVSREVTLSVHFATSDSLRSLMTLGCRALHFSGHGSPQHLYFEDGLGTVHPIPINDLKNLCISKNSPLRLVVVQACYSHNVATAFLSCGIPHVIAIKFDQKIEDIASSVFTKAFYTALATGHAVNESFYIGQEAVRSSPRLAQAAEAACKFVLLPDGADHSEVIFPTLDVKTSAAPTMVPNPTRFPVLWGSTKLPAACPHFCHRTIEQYHVIHELVKEQPSVSRYVWISGPEGVGKTQLAYACCRYMHPRRYFAGGIRFISVHQLVSTKSSMATRQAVAPDAIQHVLTNLRVQIDAFVRETETGPYESRPCVCT
ncbi:hypothetical protein, variant 1 [Aphanomyces invadans]|uniref:FHA domain-containing protein n=1 Tax=Aphanomyces invadans TaxID=157072 RepID=A0A024UI71_9STRA|nr:hypothetical protein, variant 1 [Aphanomyces invadans]ETW05969.1 hypothetical protein, variant 1 [Aphanomyces invadans]|eukprot:XP_008865746.1 hypothetical protein, variant 1 [Aphanomyces invadans]